MAISADQELYNEGIKNENQTYQDQVEEKSSGKEGELVSLRDIMGKVAPLNNMLSACQSFPHIEANKRLFGRLKRVFSEKGLGDARQDMMILAEDEETVKELLSEVTEELISEISGEVNGLVLYSDGTINREQSREQGRIFNELHPDNQIDVSSYAKEPINEKVEKMLFGEKYIENQIESLKMSDNEKLAFIIDQLLESVGGVDHYLRSVRDWEQSGKEYAAPLTYEEAVQTKEKIKAATAIDSEIDEVVKKSYSDLRYQPVLEILKFLEEKNIFDPPMNCAGRAALYVLVTEAIADYETDPLIMAETARKDELIMKKVLSHLPELMDQAHKEQIDFFAKRGVNSSVKNANELKKLQLVNLALNAKKALQDKEKGIITPEVCLYHQYKYKEFMAYYGEEYGQLDIDENGIAILPEEYIEDFEKNQINFMLYKIEKDLPKSFHFEELDGDDKIKVLKRYVQGFYLHEEMNNGGWKMDYLEAIERCLGEDVIDKDRLVIREDVFLKKFQELGGKEFKSMQELYENALSENKHSHARFLTDRETDLRDGYFISIPANKKDSDSEILERIESAGKIREDDYLRDLENREYPSTYNDAMKLSFISNFLVGDFESNRRLAQKNPWLNDLVKEGNLTNEAKKFYHKAYEEQLSIDIEKMFKEGVPNNPYRIKQALQLISQGVLRSDKEKEMCLSMLKKIDPSLVIQGKFSTRINPSRFISYYNELEKATGNDEKFTKLDEVRERATNRFHFAYDKKFGQIRETFVNLVEKRTD